jgi:acetylornithine deacetylase
LTPLGGRIDRLPTDETGKLNVLARFGPEGPGGLMLSGHLDVVPARQPGWTSDPFQLTDGGDRWIGRGAVDMKGFVALCLVVAERLDPASLRGPLVLLFTCDEEVGSIGAQHFVRQAAGRLALPPSAIIGEPTEMRVVRLHKGHMRLRVTVHGAAAHSGYPKLGDNAIEKAAGAIAALAGLRRDLEAERCASSRYFAECPYSILTVAMVDGGTAFNIVPDRCEIGVGIRLLPGQSSREIVDRVSECLIRSPGLRDGVTVDVLNDSPPLLTEAERPICRRLCAMMGQRDGAAVHYASDAGPLSTLGIDCVLWGPGSISVAHKPNEYMLKRDFSAGLEWLTRIVDECCVSCALE